MKSFIKLGVISSILIVIFSSLVQAKPMKSPTLEEAIKSEHIVIAEYEGYSIWGRIDYFYGVKAKFKVIDILKGNEMEETIKVRYSFTDGSACMEPRGWHFSKEMMPTKGSRWILFLERKYEGEYYTYRGDYGRWEANERNIQKVNEKISCFPIISKYNN